MPLPLGKHWEAVGRKPALLQESVPRSSTIWLSKLLLLLLLATAHAMSTVKPHRFIWFCRNDLRLHDNPCLAKIMAHKGPKEVLPV